MTECLEYLVGCIDRDLCVVAGHDGAVKPSIVYGTKKALVDTLRGSTDRNSRMIWVEGDDSLGGCYIARQPFEGDFD